ncbi:hypothetical protein EVAR_50225_1 [Eumeta japonica]|uniref:Uncharacterized protein n=1 Tax=Eumeta variegata TaxID=151549 RepID=A0A4C1X0H0_EUMVA|nr:hypothetical protein EVAR_50225_1 [Eumeta japonica]
MSTAFYYLKENLIRNRFDVSIQLRRNKRVPRQEPTAGVGGGEASRMENQNNQYACLGLTIPTLLQLISQCDRETEMGVALRLRVVQASPLVELSPAPIIGIGKEKDPSASYMQAHTIGNYALACCNVLRDDEASLRMPHRPVACRSVSISYFSS